MENTQNNDCEFDIFISYSRMDSQIVYDLVECFQHEGFKVWIDKNGIEIGDAYKSKIVSAIENSKLVLFFSSKNSNNSEWTAKEIGIANNRKKTIIPIKLDNSSYNPDIEFDIINLNFIDYRSFRTREEDKKKLISTLHKKLKENTPLNNLGSFHETVQENKNRNISMKFWASNKRGCELSIAFMVFLCILFPALSTLFFTVSSPPKPDENIVMSPRKSNQELVLQVKIEKLTNIKDFPAFIIGHVSKDNENDHYILIFKEVPDDKFYEMLDRKKDWRKIGDIYQYSARWKNGEVVPVDADADVDSIFSITIHKSSNMFEAELNRYNN